MPIYTTSYDSDAPLFGDYPTTSASGDLVWDLSGVDPSWNVTALSARLVISNFGASGVEPFTQPAFTITDVLTGDSLLCDDLIQDQQCFLDVDWADEIPWLLANAGNTHVHHGTATLGVSYDPTTDFATWGYGAYTLAVTYSEGSSGSVTVCATESCSGSPLVGASVTVGGIAGTTGASGCVTLGGVPSGSQSWVVSATGYTSTSGTVSVPGGGSNSVSTELTPPLGCPTCSLTITATNACTGNPLVGASALRNGAGATSTNGSGQAVFTGIYPGAGAWSVSLAGYGTASGTYTCTLSGALSASASLTPTSGCCSTCNLTVTTLHACGGALSGVTVGSLGTTDASGILTATGIASGSHSYLVSKTGYDSQTIAFSCPCSGQSYSYELTLTPHCPSGFLFTLDNCQCEPLPHLSIVTLTVDADDLEPDDQTTCDVTPTFTWEATDGTEPYTYTWTLTADPTSGTLQSGQTSLSQVTLAGVSPGDYLFNVQATDLLGNSSSVFSYAFVVLNCVQPPFVGWGGSGGPRGEDGFPSDIYPRSAGFDGFLRYLPRWLSCYGTATAPASGSLLYQFFQPTLSQIGILFRETEVLADLPSLLQMPLGLPRQAWLLQTRYRESQTLTVTLSASGVVRPVRRAVSEYDFLTDWDPVFLLDNQGRILLRNLAIRTVSTSGVAGVYTLPDEGNGIVGDTDVLFLSGSTWYVLKSGSWGLIPARSQITLPAEYTGTLLFQYQSRTLAPEVTVSVSGQAYQVPEQVDLWNRFDELGLLYGFGYGRRRDEDNRSYRQRLYSRCLSRRGDDLPAVTNHLGQDLVLSYVQYWNGVQTLELADLDYQRISRVEVVGVPPLISQEEELVPNGAAGKFTASKKDWTHSQLWVEGIPVTPISYPNLRVTDYTVDFGQTVSGSVRARYTYPTYQTATSSQGNITRVIPCSGNLASGDYRVVLTRDVRAWSPSDPEQQVAHLLNSDGTPNGLYRELGSLLLQDSPLYHSRARWARSAFWLSRADELPAVGYLPTVFDLET